jgi:hypothetical protein
MTNMTAGFLFSLFSFGVLWNEQNLRFLSRVQDAPEHSQQDPMDTPVHRQRNATPGSSTAHPTLLAMI